MSDHKPAGGPPPLPAEKPKAGAVKTNILPTAKAAFLEEPKAAPHASAQQGTWALPKPVRPQDKTGTAKTGMLQAPTADEIGLTPVPPALPKPVRPQDKTGTAKTGMLQAPTADEIGIAPAAAAPKGPPPVPKKKATSIPGVEKTVLRANARADFLLDDFAGDIDIPEEKAAEIGVTKKEPPKK